MGRGQSTAPTGTPRPKKTRWAALTLATGLLVAVPAAPTFAATIPVDDLAELRTALDSCPATIVLTADISAPSASLPIVCDTTLDLSTHNLSVSQMAIRTGATLTVTGPTDGSGGTLTADASGSHGAAGITTTGATLTVTGGTVIARGGAGGAGIGGAYYSTVDAGTLNVAGGTVNAYAGDNSAAVGGGAGVNSRGGNGGSIAVSSGTLNAYNDRPAGVAVGGGNTLSSGAAGSGATIAVTGGTLTATASASNGTAIGGGAVPAHSSQPGGSGGSLHVGSGGEVIAAAPANIFGGGWNVVDRQIAHDFGSLTVEGTLRLPSGRLYIPAGKGMIVGATGRLVGSTIDPTVGASLAGGGIITNRGSITLSSPPTGMVDGNNTFVYFVSTAASNVQVLAPTFADGARTLPAPPPGTAWNTAADGSGTWFTSTTPLGGASFLNLYAVAPATITVPSDPALLSFTAGESIFIWYSIIGPDGKDVSPFPTVTTRFHDCRLDGSSVTTAGSCTVTASTTVRGVLVQKTFTIQIVPGPVASMSLEPPTATVTQGSAVTFGISAVDAYGNAIDTAAATLTSSRGADTIDGHTVTFSGAGTHAITATLQGGIATADVEVVAGPVSTLLIRPQNEVVTQGDSITFTITGTDAGGNPVDTTAAALTSSGPDAIDGHTITFSGAGPRLIVAALDGIETATSVLVLPGPLATLSLTPSSETVVEGGTTVFRLTGADAAGNPVDVDAATLTSTASTDVVDRHLISFSGAGVRTVTATLNGVTTTAEITVVPGPLSTLTITPSSKTVTQGDVVDFTVAGTDSGGNPVDTHQAILSSSTSGDAIVGHSVTFSGAGTHTITTTLDGVTTSATIEVVAGPLATLTLTPATTTVAQGTTTTFLLSGTDSAGNPVNVDAATLASTADTDVVDGRAVTFSGAGPRTITATLGSVTATASIGVVPGPVATLTLTPRSASVVQGATLGFDITAADSAGNPIDATAAVLTSDTPADTVTGRSVTFSGAGTHLITATLGSVTTSATIEVTAGPLSTLTLTPATSSVTQGDTTVFTVAGTDAAGNPVDTGDAVLTSTAGTDTIDGRAITFSGAGTRTITATLGSVTATTTVEVVAGPLTTLSLTPSTATATQGGTVEFTITGTDAAGNPVDTTGAVLSSSNTGDTVDGHSLTFSGAGTHTITATLADVTAIATVMVTPGPAASLTITPSATAVDQGGTLTFTVEGADAAGNPVDTSTATLTSSADTDVIAGSTVTFPHASPHTITATLETLTATVTVQVTPAPVPAPAPTASPSPTAPAAAGLANTGVDRGIVAAIGGSALALLLAGGALLLLRRNRHGSPVEQASRR